MLEKTIAQLKAELVSNIASGNTEEAKKVIESIAKNFNEKDFYTAFGGGENSLNDYPVLAALMYGQQDIFKSMFKNIPGLSENLHKAISANHTLVNMGVLPCLGNEEKLQQAHAILDAIDKNLSWEQIKECKLFALSAFFLHEKLVDKFLSKGEFAEVANEKGSRSAAAINYVASNWDKDDRCKPIFDKLFKRQEIRDDLKNDPNILSQFLSTNNFAALQECISQNLIDQNALKNSWPAFLGCLAQFNQDPSKELGVICQALVEVQSGHNFILRVDGNITFMPPKLQEMLVCKILRKISSDLNTGKISLENIYTGNSAKGLEIGAENFINLIAKNETWLSGIKIPEADLAFLKERKKAIEANEKQYKDNIEKQKDKLQTFDDEVLNAEKVWYHTLRRGVDIKSLPDDKQMPFGHAIDDEQRRTAVLQRLFLTLGGGNLQVKKPGTKDWVSAKDNGLPLAMEFASGPRVLIEIPKITSPEEEHQFFNWLTCGDSSGRAYFNPNVSDQSSGVTALGDGKIIFTRPFATHGLSVDGGGHVKETGLKEIKVDAKKPVALLSMLTTGTANNLGLAAFTGHFGMNVGVGKYDDFDVKGKTIRPDGATGHLYMYYQPPTATTPGGILLGMEGSEPHVDGQFGHHSMTGASDLLTVAGGRPSPELAAMDKNKSKNHKDSFIADRYNGRRLVLTKDVMKDLYTFDMSQIKDPGIMAVAKAQTSVAAFATVITSDKFSKDKEKEKLVEPELYTFEALSSPNHALFLSSDLKKNLISVLGKLAVERSDTIAAPELKNLQQEYKEIFTNIKTALDEQFPLDKAKHIENFRKSVEEYIASLGRNQRHKLVYNVHKEVMKNPTLPMHGSSAGARTYNIGKYFWDTITANRAQGVGIAHGLTRPDLHLAMATMVGYNVGFGIESDRSFLVAKDKDKSLLITSPADDIMKDSDRVGLGINIKTALTNAMGNAEYKKKFLAGDLEIAIPYAQSLDYSSWMPGFTRRHWTMLHVKFDPDGQKIIAQNFDPKSAYHSASYPIEHIKPWLQDIALSLGENTKYELVSKSLGWQSALNNQDCGRFVLVMLQKLRVAPVEQIGAMKSADILSQVGVLAKGYESDKIDSIMSFNFNRELTAEVSMLLGNLKKCIFNLYTNTITPNDEDIGRYCKEYQEILKQLLEKKAFEPKEIEEEKPIEKPDLSASGFEDMKEERLSEKERFNKFRSDVEVLLGEARRHRRLVGAYGAHCQVMQEKGWEKPVMVNPLTWSQAFADMARYAVPSIISVPANLLYAAGSTVAGATAGLYNYVSSIAYGPSSSRSPSPEVVISPKVAENMLQKPDGEDKDKGLNKEKQ